jgi:hypothetical protein
MSHQLQQEVGLCEQAEATWSTNDLIAKLFSMMSTLQAKDIAIAPPTLVLPTTPVTTTLKMSRHTPHGLNQAPSAHFLTFPLFSSTLLYSPLLSHTHPCSYVHSPTLCTITRCQTLNADDSRPQRCRLVHSLITIVVNIPPFPSALTSEASDELRTHWDRSTQYYGTLRHHMDIHIWEAWY